MDRPLVRRPSFLLTILASLVLVPFASAFATVIPTSDPGGFEIEGDLIANSPTIDVTDWVPHDPGNGVGLSSCTQSRRAFGIRCGRKGA